MKKWTPSKAQKRAFAEKMANDPEFKAAYEARKRAREEKRRASSIFEYSTAGGEFIPTRVQYEEALELLNEATTEEQKAAANIVISGYAFKEKVHHDFIHIVNEYSRTKAAMQRG